MNKINPKAIYKALFLDKNGHFVVAQFPNAPLLIWLAAIIIDKLVSDATASTVISIIGTTALLVWAILELYSGVNLFRKLLGATILAFIIISYFFKIIT